jgi:hypothetical protein
MTYVIQDPAEQVKYDEVLPENNEQRALVAGYERRREQRAANRGHQREALAAITIDKPWE